MYTLRQKLGKGFTLIELLIVITIIGILAVALVPKITGAPAMARDTARKAAMSTIATGLESYVNESTTGTYPGTVAAGLGAGQCLLDTGDAGGKIKDKIGGSVPLDPQKTTSRKYTDVITACVGGYYYIPLGNGSSGTGATGYMIGTLLEKKTGNNDYCFGNVAAVDDGTMGVQTDCDATDDTGKIVNTSSNTYGYVYYVR